MSGKTWCGINDPEHRVKYCRPCLRIYVNQRRAAKRAGGKLVVRVAEPDFIPSALNRRVTAKHTRCAERGGCVPGPTVMSYGYVFNPCRRCDVPVKPRGWAWRDNTTMFPERAA